MRYKRIIQTLVMSFIILSVTKWSIIDYSLKKYGSITLGKVINEQGYNGKGGHLSKEGNTIIYRYSFRVNGRTYSGDTQDSQHQIGDTIKIVYWDKYPEINRPHDYIFHH